MTNDQIQEILKAHAMWLNSAGEKGERADLRGADLSGADLSGANLSVADLRGADLRGADLSGVNLSVADLSVANLRGADLSVADLRGADLSGANLRGAYLSGADLSGADLRGANLSGANLRGAYLSGADLSVADLSGANLRGANLRGANLSEAYLSGADLRGANLSGADANIPMACPDLGAFIGWKKAGNKIVKLQIPEGAKRSSATGRKCRCDKALVLAIEDLNGSATNLTSIKSNFDGEFVYRVGEMVMVDDFDTDRFNECAPGIHFFINRQEAVDYL